MFFAFLVLLFMIASYKTDILTASTLTHVGTEGSKGLAEMDFYPDKPLCTKTSRLALMMKKMQHTC